MHNNTSSAEFENNSIVNKINMSSTTGFKEEDNSPMIANEVRDYEKDPEVKKSSVHISYKQTWIRWLVLFFACCFLLGSYFCYDNPGPIEKTMESDLNIP